ncbi:MAG TPA: DNA topoisomerase IV subunit A, partial [Nitrosomonas nitrosa]|nr:DNA topoisomerase IV subunit A [Nitrosomonas nitrosa]
KKFGDDRRTLIQAAERVVAKAVSVADEPCTIILSRNGWIRQRTGHDIDINTLSFKDGDQLLAIEHTRTTYPVVVLDSGGRAYSLSTTDIPGGRSDGVPLASLLDMPPKTKAAAMCAASPQTRYLFSSSGGYGFIASLKDLVSRQKAGKAFMTLNKDDRLLQPADIAHGNLVVVLGSNGKLLSFPLSEMKELSGGKGVILLGLKEGETLIATAVLPEGAPLLISGTGRGGKRSQSVLTWEELQPFVSHRARRGTLAPVKFKPEKIAVVRTGSMEKLP